MGITWGFIHRRWEYFTQLGIIARLAGLANRNPLNAPENLSAIDRREFAVRFVKLAALLALPSGAFSAANLGPNQVIVRRDVRVRMRDGVQLATDVYLPAQAPPVRVAAILERTPYGKSQDGTRHASIEVANLFASHGYAVGVSGLPRPRQVRGQVRQIFE